MRTIIIAVATLVALAAYAEQAADAIADAVRNAVLQAEGKRLRETGVSAIPVDDLPEALVRSLGLEPGTTISVERFIDPAFQDALLEHGTGLPEREGDFEPPPEVLADPAVLRAVRARFGPNARIVSDPDVVEAFRNAENREALQASLEELLGDNFQLVDSHEVGLPVDSMPWEGLPTEEVLERLDPLDQRLLRPYRDLLDDHWALSDAMPRMNPDERAAATRFPARISHHVACANNKCFEYQLLVSDSQGVGICRLRWPRVCRACAAPSHRSFGPVRALKRVGARATSTVGPLCFSVASTRTGQNPRRSSRPVVRNAG